MRDTVHNLGFRVAISPRTVSNNNAIVGEWIDRLGFESLTFAIATGELADSDAEFAVLVEHSDGAGLEDSPSEHIAVAVADDFLLSAQADVAPEVAAGFDFADDTSTKKIGYVGSNRYVRLTITPSGNSGNAPIAAIAVLGHPHHAPTE